MENTASNIISAVKENSKAFQKKLKNLYPCVDDLTKLPQCWSTDYKAQPLGLTYDSLGCYFRGNGFRDDDDKSAAAIRTDQHIPQSCLLYYFEVKCISRGREGRIAVGLAPSQVSLNKLPGWMQGSYGYHAEDGNTYSSEYKGLPCGPPSTSGDIIGCGYNLVEGKCFFTKNGLKIGKTFDCVPNNISLHPTVGLKTPGEEIRANFGQEDFIYDIEQDLRSLRRQMTINISNHPISDFGEWQSTLHELVQTWLLQNSYPNTAEAFTQSAKLDCKANISRVQQRNKIQQLVLDGKISEAIRFTNRLCPGLLDNNPNLLFTLKCRQFVELISGAESECEMMFKTDNMEDKNNGSHIIEADGDQVNNFGRMQRDDGRNGMLDSIENNINVNLSGSTSSLQELMDIDQPTGTMQSDSTSSMNATDTQQSENAPRSCTGDKNLFINQQLGDRLNTNGNLVQLDRVEDIEFEKNKKRFGKLIQFGRELTNYSLQLDRLYGKNQINEKMLKDAIGLIAYQNPQDSSPGKILDAKQRESVSQLLNSSIVKAEMGDMYRPPLEDVVNHLRNLIKLNDGCGSWLIDELY